MESGKGSHARSYQQIGNEGTNRRRRDLTEQKQQEHKSQGHVHPNNPLVTVAEQRDRVPKPTIVGGTGPNESWGIDLRGQKKPQEITRGPQVEEVLTTRQERLSGQQRLDPYSHEKVPDPIEVIGYRRSPPRSRREPELDLYARRPARPKSPTPVASRYTTYDRHESRYFREESRHYSSHESSRDLYYRRSRSRSPRARSPSPPRSRDPRDSMAYSSSYQSTRKPPFRDFGSIEALSYALDPVQSSPKKDPRTLAISSPLSQPAPPTTAKPPFRNFGSIEALSYALEPVARSPKGAPRSPASAVSSPAPPRYRTHTPGSYGGGGYSLTPDPSIPPAGYSANPTPQTYAGPPPPREPFHSYQPQAIINPLAPAMHQPPPCFHPSSASHPGAYC